MNVPTPPSSVSAPDGSSPPDGLPVPDGAPTSGRAAARRAGLWAATAPNSPAKLLPTGTILTRKLRDRLRAALAETTNKTDGDDDLFTSVIETPAIETSPAVLAFVTALETLGLTVLSHFDKGSRSLALLARDESATPVLSVDSSSLVVAPETIALAPPPTGAASAEKFLEMVATPGAKSVAQVASMLGSEPRHLVKTLVYLADDEPVLLLIRGDRTLGETKTKAALGATSLRVADDATVRKILGAPPEFAGPLGILGVRIVADLEVAPMRNFIAGANQSDAHHVHVNHGRDFFVTAFADLRRAEPGDTIDGKPLVEIRARLVATATPGTLRVDLPALLSCLVETRHDTRGLTLPVELAPFPVALIVAADGPDTSASARDLVQTLRNSGIDAKIDDRPVDLETKLADADCLGVPLRVVFGDGLARGTALISERGDVGRAVPLSEIPGEIARILSRPE